MSHDLLTGTTRFNELVPSTIKKITAPSSTIVAPDETSTW